MIWILGALGLVLGSSIGWQVGVHFFNQIGLYAAIITAACGLLGAVLLPWGLRVAAGRLGRQLQRIPQMRLNAMLIGVFLGLAAAAFLSMIVPLYVFAREGLKVKGLWPLLGFFSSLGMGFMFLELGLIQRLNVYLGHPMHSLAVVLAGLLFFTGLGSYRAGTIQYDIKKLLKKGMIGAAISAILWLAVMSVVIPLTLGWPLWIRIIITLLSILPVGLVAMVVGHAHDATALLVLADQRAPGLWITSSGRVPPAACLAVGTDCCGKARARGKSRHQNAGPVMPGVPRQGLV